jgi:hypothetical protein
MTLEFTQAWRDGWDRGDFGSLTNPAGIAVFVSLEVMQLPGDFSKC